MPHVGNHLRRFLVAIIVVTAIIPTVAASAAGRPAPMDASAARRTFPRLGDHSPEVERLQRLLMAAGVHVKGGADGAFGPGTAAAVATFQRARSLHATGVVDAATATALGLIRPRAVLTVGDHGAAVTTVQRRLQASGLHVKGGADGAYGPATADAVRLFQRAHGLRATGFVDDYTAALLAAKGAPGAGASAPRATLPRPGTSGSAVRLLQQRLTSLGDRPWGGVDGNYGPFTMAAVAVFQRWMGLRASGVLDAATQRALLGATGASSGGTRTLEHFPLPRTCQFWDTFGAPRAGGRHHEGADIFARLGTPVYAVADGRITTLRHDFAGSRGGNQFWLTSSTDGTKYFYGHLDHFARGIGVGVPVHAGDVIGYAGKTGLTTVVHLHFEVHPGGGGPVNPYPILRRSSGC